jgi:hypothetical protein
MSRDFIAECNNFEVSPSDFEKVWCIRCKNTECRRTRSDAMTWTARVQTQTEALFNPTRGDPRDPAYARLASQEFRCVNPQEGHPTDIHSIIEVNRPTQFVSGGDAVTVARGSTIVMGKKDANI